MICLKGQICIIYFVYLSSVTSFISYYIWIKWKSYSADDTQLYSWHTVHHLKYWQLSLPLNLNHWMNANRFCWNRMEIMFIGCMEKMRDIYMSRCRLGCTEMALIPLVRNLGASIDLELIMKTCMRIASVNQCTWKRKE